MKARFLIPLGIFVALVALFAVGLNLDPRKVPSPLIDKPAPAFDLQRLRQQDARISQADFKQHPVSLFNVFASWCVACRQEHPVLMEIAKQKVLPVFGLNYKDERTDGLRWLGQFGDPYTAIAYDLDGRVGIDWGVYGVPETFVIDRKGMIRYKHIGPLTAESIKTDILPLLKQLEGEPA